jgi:putative FmdB family regulatory protein
MPIFEYQCRECGARFERIVGSSAAEVSCKQCESSNVFRLLSVFAVTASSGTMPLVEPGPCGACGAPRRGMCGET